MTTIHATEDTSLEQGSAILTIRGLGVRPRSLFYAVRRSGGRESLLFRGGAGAQWARVPPEDAWLKPDRAWYDGADLKLQIGQSVTEWLDPGLSYEFAFRGQDLDEIMVPYEWPKLLDLEDRSAGESPTGDTTSDGGREVIGAALEENSLAPVPPKPEPQKPEPPKPEPQKPGSRKPEAPKPEPLKPEPPKPEPPKPEPPKPNPPKPVPPPLPGRIVWSAIGLIVLIAFLGGTSLGQNLVRSIANALSPSVVQLPSPPVHDTPPPVHDTPPPVHNALPPVHDTLPPVHNALPPVHDTLPPVHNALPPVHDTSPPVRDRLPPVHDTPPPPPPHDDTPSSAMNAAMRSLNTQNFPDAIARLKELAASSDPAGRALAEYKLATIYLSKDIYHAKPSQVYPGSPTDDREGMGWMRKAAEDGNRFAQFVMGKVAADAHDYAVARQWLLKAQEQGEPNSGDELNHLPSE